MILEIGLEASTEHTVAAAAYVVQQHEWGEAVEMTQNQLVNGKGWHWTKERRKKN